MPRKTASDSRTSVAQVMAKAMAKIEPPEHEPLFDGAHLYWEEILSARANTDWPAEDLTLAAKLANLMLLHKEAQTELREEGHTAFGAQGQPIPHPLVSVCKAYMSDIKVIRTDLQIHGRGKNGEARDAGKRRGQRKGRQKAATDTKSNLFAGEGG